MPSAAGKKKFLRAECLDAIFEQFAQAFAAIEPRQDEDILAERRGEIGNAGVLSEQCRHIDCHPSGGAPPWGLAERERPARIERARCKPALILVPGFPKWFSRAQQQPGAARRSAARSILISHGRSRHLPSFPTRRSSD